MIGHFPIVSNGAGAPRSPDLAYAAIKAKILDSEYQPGSQVLEGRIAAETGLSRTPVREALVRLQHEGLIEITPRHGVRISVLSAADMREIYDILESLESTAAALLARRAPGPAELAPLAAACDAMERALDRPEPDLKAWAAADEAFHMSLVRSCGNRRLAATVMAVWDQAHRARMFTLTLRPVPRRSTAEHRAILKAIAAGDPERARALYLAHRTRGGEELLALIERHGLRRL